MTPYWFKPEHQPKPEEPVEFQVKPIDLRTAYDVQMTLYPNGAVSSEMVRTIFLANVLDWKGLPEKCTTDARIQVLSTTEGIFEATFVDWVIWTGHVARSAYLRSIMTEEERKNL